MVLGSDVQSDYREARRKLGVVPQELGVRSLLHVREALRIQSGYFGVKNNDAWIDELLDSLGLADKANANMRQLSGGMKRRVLVAQALVHKPPVIVLDEPTAGVDVELRQTLWQFIARLNKQGHTVLLTTHYLEEAEALCSRIAMLKNGRVVALETTSELLKSASSNVLRFKMDGALPPQFEGKARVTGRIVQLPAHDAHEIESYLGDHPPGRPAGGRRGDPQGRPRGRVPRPDGGRKGAGVTGWRTLLYKEVLRFWKVSFQTVAAPVLTAVLYLLIFGHVLSATSRSTTASNTPAFPDPGPGDDERAAERLRQQLLLADPEQDHRQPRVRAADAAVRTGAGSSPTSALGRARPGRRASGVFAVTAFFARPDSRRPLWILVFAVHGRSMLGALGLIAGPLGREVRPHGGLPELRHHADDLPVRRLLFDPLAARLLAGCEPPQPVFLHDRRLPLWLLRSSATSRPG
jgi:ABC-type Na+ transport system ATPase subunit NatA